MIEDFLAGRRVSQDSVAQAINEVAWAIGGGLGAHPGLFEEHHVDDGTSNPMPGFRPPPHWQIPRVPPPPDPALEERRRARQVLGFADGQQVTAEEIKLRQRELAKRHHPDRGGSVAKMQEINAAVDTLMEGL